MKNYFITSALIQIAQVLEIISTCSFPRAGYTRFDVFGEDVVVDYERLLVVTENVYFEFASLDTVREILVLQAMALQYVRGILNNVE